MLNIVWFWKNCQTFHTYLSIYLLFIYLYKYTCTYLHGKYVYERMHKVSEGGGEEGRWKVKHTV